MKRWIALFLACSIALVGCTQNTSAGSPAMETGEFVAETDGEHDLTEIDGQKAEEQVLSFDSLSDPKLLDYVEKTVYSGLSEELSGDEYVIENVSAVYISKEYLEEAAYNSQSNIWFGYTLEELNEQYAGVPYVFTLGDEGETVVVPFENYDDTYDTIIRNVAIGTGVILVCVTVSAVTAGMGAPAISMIFAASAKTGTIFAASSAAMSGIITTAITGIQTGDVKEAFKQGALSASESFKWGAIGGSLTGGAMELVTLKIAAKGGLTLDEVAIIMRNTDLPANFVKQIHSMEEYEELVRIAQDGGLALKDMAAICMSTDYPLEVVKLFKSTKEGLIYYEQAGLVSETVGGETALICNIDLAYESELAGKTVTNLERMRQGYAAIDPATGKALELHHIGQNVNSPLAVLTERVHREGENYGILHDVNIADGTGVHALISDSQWAAQRQKFWKALAEFLTK